MDPLPYYKWHWRDYRANRRVQRMSWQAKGLYRELLDEFWAEGCLPLDHADLADICGCTAEEFSNLWPEMEGCWEVVNGSLTNAKMDSMRTSKDAERVAKSESGRIGGKASNSLTRAQEMQAESKHKEASAKQVLAGAKEMQAQPDIAEQSRAEQRIPSRDKREVDSRHSPFKEILGKAWKVKNTSEMTWGPGEAKQLSLLLSSNPSLTADAFRHLLHNRHKSSVNQSERPLKWLPSLTDYASGPIDRYGKPMTAPADVTPALTIAEKIARSA